MHAGQPAIEVTLQAGSAAVPTSLMSMRSSSSFPCLLLLLALLLPLPPLSGPLPPPLPWTTNVLLMAAKGGVKCTRLPAFWLQVLF
jgi:hypothetical protein